MTLLAFQAAVLGLAVLLLFRLRPLFGLVPLYVLLGALQVVQTLSGPILVSIAPAVAISPGSAVLFSAGLAAVLLVYIREDAIEARRLIYALVAANVTVGMLLISIAWQVGAPGTVNLVGISAQVFANTARDLVVGTGLLAVDTVAVVILYEFLAHRLGGLFVPVAGTMMAVLCLDSVIYISFTMSDRPDYAHILGVSITAKALAALWFASLVTYYLRRYDRDADPELANARDIFSILTYRQKYELARAAAVRDDLTGVFNRSYFNANFAGMLRTSRERAQPLALLFLDIDDFKRINDGHGHAAGDRVIAAVAKLLEQSSLRPECVCRYGGEEFVAVLPGAAGGAAARAAERLRCEVETARTVDELGVALTVTIGVACFPDDAADAEGLIEIADRRLYAGKRAGRNRVVSSG